MSSVFMLRGRTQVVCVSELEIGQPVRQASPPALRASHSGQPLARQVGEASREAQRSRWSELHNQLSLVADSWAGNGELSDIVFRGFTDRESLTPNESFRFYANLFRAFRVWEALFEYSREGGLVTWGMEASMKPLTDILGFPGAAKYWRDRRQWFSSTFQVEVDRLLQQASPTMVKAYGREE